MSLDCVTPEGKFFISKQDLAAARFAEIFKCQFTQTGSAASADIDAIFSRRGTIVAIAEIKCRKMSWEQLRGFKTYLITHDKLVRGADLSRRLCAPFIVLVYLLSDDSIVYWRVTNERGEITTEFSVRYTDTQATCNGGNAQRANAYLPVESGKKIR